MSKSKRLPFSNWGHCRMLRLGRLTPHIGTGELWWGSHGCNFWGVSDTWNLCSNLKCISVACSIGQMNDAKATDSAAKHLCHPLFNGEDLYHHHFLLVKSLFCLPAFHQQARTRISAWTCMKTSQNWNHQNGTPLKDLGPWRVVSRDSCFFIERLLWRIMCEAVVC